MNTVDTTLREILCAVGKYVAVVLTMFLSVPGVHAAGEKVNLLANGGFEKDADGDGVADGWIAQPFSFSRQKPEDIQAYINNLPPGEELLKGQKIPAADGTPIWTRKADGNWDPM